jgi:hypothetical protein
MGPRINILKEYEFMSICLCILDVFYKQKNGKINNNGNRNGTAINDKPHVQVLPTIAVIIIPNTVADTIKHPPYNRTETCIVGGSVDDFVFVL